MKKSHRLINIGNTNITLYVVEFGKDYPLSLINIPISTEHDSCKFKMCLEEEEAERINIELKDKLYIVSLIDFTSGRTIAIK